MGFTAQQTLDYAIVCCPLLYFLRAYTLYIIYRRAASEPPPFLLRCRKGSAYVAGVAVDAFSYDVLPRLAVCYHLVDGPPVGQSSDATVVYPHIYFELAREVIIVVLLLFWIVTIYCIELYSTLTTPVYGFLKLLSLADCPQHKAVMVVDKHLEGVDGERLLLADLRLSVCYYRTVKIYCDCHCCA